MQKYWKKLSIYFSKLPIVFAFTLLFLPLSFTACGAPRLQLLEQSSYQPAASFKIENYCPQTGYQFISAFGFSWSATLSSDGDWLPDFDRDFIVDGKEASAIHSTSLGYRDGIVNLLFSDASRLNTLGQCTTPGQDTDHDGLWDCEEVLLGTDPINPDDDSDGISDSLEVRFGLNPTDPSDVNLDSDRDGVSNFDEVATGTVVQSQNVPRSELRKLKYKITEREQVSSSQALPVSQTDCFDLEVSNVPLLDVKNGNLIEFQMMERSLIDGTHVLQTVRVLVPYEFSDPRAILIRNMNHRTVDPRVEPFQFSGAGL